MDYYLKPMTAPVHHDLQGVVHSNASYRFRYAEARHGLPLRAVRTPTACCGARLHAGRRAHLLHARQVVDEFAA